MSHTRHLDCGCYARRPSSSGPGHPPIVFCPLHSQAEGMRDLLQTLTQVAVWDGQGKIGQTKEYLVPFGVVERARALLRAVEGK